MENGENLICYRPLDQELPSFGNEGLQSHVRFIVVPNIEKLSEWTGDVIGEEEKIESLKTHGCRELLVNRDNVPKAVWTISRNFKDKQRIWPLSENEKF
jgi:hypothetical protein